MTRVLRLAAPGIAALGLGLGMGACADAPADTAGAAAEPVAGAADTSALPVVPVAEVLDALRGMPGEELWPGFDPSTVPVALYDGARTWLVAHPEPPAAFAPAIGLPGVAVLEGRHAAVRGNMPTEIGGVRTAAVMLDELRGLSAERAAAVVAHERFHVYLLNGHPEWTVNELARFQYPVSDARQLFDRRLETLALERAIRAATPSQSECWLRTALILRRKRMSDLPPAVAEYERGVERQEGLARYIERRAARIRTPVDLAPQGYPPEQVRERAYVTGEALAMMLDRYAYGWKDVIENAGAEPPPLDSLLWVALLERPETSCGFSAEERGQVLERAVDAVSVMRAQRVSQQRSFENQSGWRIRVLAEETPLWPQSFDPMSLTRIGSASLLHDRMLRAGNDFGSIDIFGRRALTTGYLDDPLASGIREVLVAGLADRPTLTPTEEGGIEIRAEGVTASFAAAQVLENEQEIVVRLR